MGIRNRNLVREGLRGRSRNKKQTKMFFKVLTSASLMSLSVLAAPQYAGVVPSHPVKTAPLTGSVQCRTEYATLWDTEYKETETEVCTTEYEPYTETECVTEYKEDCEYQWEGHGHDKVWAPIAGTCKTNPYETCKDVAKTKEKQVAYPVCNDVPEQKCVSVPRQECVTVPDQVCTNQPLQKCQDVPRQACQAIHKKVPVRVSRQVPKKVCDGHSVIDNAVPAHNLVPSPVSSLPEILDARRENENKQNTLLFERSQVADSPSDNAIVFGD